MQFFISCLVTIRERERETFQIINQSVVVTITQSGVRANIECQINREKAAGPPLRTRLDKTVGSLARSSTCASFFHSSTSDAHHFSKFFK